MHIAFGHSLTLFQGGDRTRSRRRTLAPIRLHLSPRLACSASVAGALRIGATRGGLLYVSGEAPTPTHTRSELHLEFICSATSRLVVSRSARCSSPAPARIHSRAAKALARRHRRDREVKRLRDGSLHYKRLPPLSRLHARRLGHFADYRAPPLRAGVPRVLAPEDVMLVGRCRSRTRARARRARVFSIILRRALRLNVVFSLRAEATSRSIWIVISST
jgi:hypothetical protein